MPQIDPEELISDEVERVARALVSQMAPLVGARGVGTATVTAVGADYQLAPNQYAFPVIGGQVQEGRLVKTAWNPATITKYVGDQPVEGGEWTVTSAGTEVSFVSAIGGVAGNLPAGTQLRWSPLIPELEPTADITTAWTGGDNSGTVRQVLIYEELGSDSALEQMRAGVGSFPAIILGWLRRTPADGRTSGVPQGRTRKGRAWRIYFDEWAVYAFAGSATGTGVRRREGQRTIELATGAVDMRMQNDDGEQLYVLAQGLEVQSVQRIAGGPNVSIFQALIRTATGRQKSEAREFAPWLRTRVREFFEARDTLLETGPGVGSGDLDDFTDTKPGPV